MHPPTASEADNLIVCEYCDSVYRRPPLSRFQKALCQRCGAVIHRHHLLTVEHLLALSVTALMLMVFVSFYPVLFISARGQTGGANMVDSVMAMMQGPISLMGLVVAFAVVVAPALQAALLVWVLGFARRGRRAPGFRWCMRTLETLRPWGMLEVFLLAALVAAVKMKGPLAVAPAAGLFALAALSLLMIGIAGRDIRMLWKHLP